jgi:MFS family permease
MDTFLKRFFPNVYRQKQDTKLSHYCEFNNELLTMFTSSLYIAGLVATLVAASITRRYGRRVSILIGGTIFIAGSVFGGLAVNVPMLILNRILLGIGLGFTNQVTYMLPLFIKYVIWFKES